MLSASGDVSYYVPEGTWTHFLTGEPVTGPRWRRERVYELADGARVATWVPAPAGDRVSAFVTSRQGRVIRVQAHEAPAAWQVLLVGLRDASNVDGGVAAPHEQGTLIQAGGDTLTVTLAPDA